MKENHQIIGEWRFWVFIRLPEVRYRWKLEEIKLEPSRTFLYSLEACISARQPSLQPSTFHKFVEQIADSYSSMLVFSLPLYSFKGPDPMNRRCRLLEAGATDFSSLGWTGRNAREGRTRVVCVGLVGVRRARPKNNHSPFKIQIVVQNFPMGGEYVGKHPLIFPLEKSATCVPPYDGGHLVFFLRFCY